MNPETHWHADPLSVSYSLTPQVKIGTHAFLVQLNLVLFEHTIQSLDKTVPFRAVQFALVIQGVEHDPLQFKLFERILIP